MKEIQKEFFKSLSSIQEQAVNVGLCNLNKCKSTEEMLYNISSDTIYQIMELLDGYQNDLVQLDIIDKKTKRSLREGIELHDTCVSFLR